MSGEPEDAERKARLLELQTAWYGCPGKKLQSELAGLGRSARTFVVNTHQLVLAAEWFENSLFHPLLQPANRRELWEFASEIVRLFQNTVTSGQSFLEHCRKMVRRRYNNHPFEVEFHTYYRQHVEGSPVCMFVRELRGFILHSESMSPVFSRQLSDFSDPFESTHSIAINTDALHAEKARWAKTTGRIAREYLGRVGGSINIRRLVHEYRAVLRGFSDWLLTRVREIDSEILAEGKALHDELLTLLRPDVANELQSMAAMDGVNSWFEVPEPHRRG
jgi:hypothetical protein